MPRRKPNGLAFRSLCQQWETVNEECSAEKSPQTARYGIDVTDTSPESSLLAEPVLRRQESPQFERFEDIESIISETQSLPETTAAGATTHDPVLFFTKSESLLASASSAAYPIEDQVRSISGEEGVMAKSDIKTLQCTLKTKKMFVCCVQCGMMILISWEKRNPFTVQQRTSDISHSMIVTQCKKHEPIDRFSPQPIRLSPKFLEASFLHEIATSIVSERVYPLIERGVVAFETIENLNRQLTEDCMIMGVNTEDGIDVEKDQLLLPFLPGGFL